MFGWRQTVVVAIFAAMGAQPVLAQDSAGAGTSGRGPIAIGIGVEQFGVVFERLGAIHQGILANSGQMLPTATLTVPISPRFAVQTTVAGHRTRNITGEHTDVLYGFMVNQRLGGLDRRRFKPFVTYGLLGTISHTAVPASVEWVWNGVAWEERPVPPSTRRSHRLPTLPVGGAGLQVGVWRGLALRADAELIGPSAGRVRSTLVIPIGRLD